jgi:proline dehydrogenase
VVDLSISAINILMNISFDNTEFAFAYKSDKELKKARFLFSSMAKSWLVKLGTKITPWAIKVKLPINGLIKNTIFKQFVGGETLEETKPIIDVLSHYNVKAILDYGVEGKTGEENFEKATAEFIKVIEYAASQTNIPFISIKLTGFARFSLLEKLDVVADVDSGATGKIHTGILNEDEKAEFKKVRNRLIKICGVAARENIGVLIDAEETWIQDPVDALAMQMMQLFNKEKPIVYNTVQLYRHDRLNFLKKSFGHASANECILAVKLVRGAYMEKERERAEKLNYTSPIQPDKQSTDNDYNAAIEFCVSHIDKIFFIAASHNELSNLYTTQLLQKQYGTVNHSHVHFSQLYGMSDNITFNLAKAGCSVSKYLPFGPIADVIPYLMRRAEENSSISNYTGRELALIKKELKRRKRMKIP